MVKNTRRSEDFNEIADRMMPALRIGEGVPTTSLGVQSDVKILGCAHVECTPAPIADDILASSEGQWPFCELK